jgi:cyanophycinase-like exopeptidase
MHDSDGSPGTVTLIGSGELAASMSKVHRAVMSRIEDSVQAVFLDTPAGFELNADQISAKAVEYFKRHLSVDLAVVSFKVAATATSAEVERALRMLRPARYIFAGPGSPTYAVRNWWKTAIMEALARRLAAGAHLVFASAAAIAMGRYTLPVYEVYKVGEAPHWAEGLDLLGSYGLELAIVPHWNNTEGGTFDTRYCFMGEPRWRILEDSLPDSTVVLGIDEYTACTLDLSVGQCEVIGAGQVTVRRKGAQKTFPAGTTFDLDQLRRAIPAGEHPEPQVTEETLGTYVTDFEWPEVPEEGRANFAPLVELLIEVRAQLRADEQWALADEIRDRLAELGIILEDGRTGTTWREA